MTWLYGLQLSVRLCDLGLIPDAIRPVARCLLSTERIHVRVLRLSFSVRLGNFGLDLDAAPRVGVFWVALSSPCSRKSGNFKVWSRRHFESRRFLNRAVSWLGPFFLVAPSPPRSRKFGNGRVFLWRLRSFLSRISRVASTLVAKFANFFKSKT